MQDNVVAWDNVLLGIMCFKCLLDLNIYFCLQYRWLNRILIQHCKHELKSFFPPCVILDSHGNIPLDLLKGHLTCLGELADIVRVRHWHLFGFGITWLARAAVARRVVARWTVARWAVAGRWIKQLSLDIRWFFTSGSLVISSLADVTASSSAWRRIDWAGASRSSSRRRSSSFDRLRPFRSSLMCDWADSTVGPSRSSYSEILVITARLVWWTRRSV